MYENLVGLKLIRKDSIEVKVISVKQSREDYHHYFETKEIPFHLSFDVIDWLRTFELWYNEGVLTHFWINGDCTNTNLCAFTDRITKQKIRHFNVNIDYSVSYSVCRCVDFKYIDIEKTIQEVKKMKQFTKKDLKSGMWVKYRDGEWDLLVGFDGNKLGLLTKDGHFNCLDEFRDGLTSIIDSMDDIIEVKNTTEAKELSRLNFMEAETIWKRQEKSTSQLKFEQMQEKYSKMREEMDNFEKEMQEFAEKELK